MDDAVTGQAGGVRHGRSALALAVLVLATAACSTAPPAAQRAAPPAPAFEAMLADAAKARQEGSRNRERDSYRAAAAAYPTRKEPWGHLAEGYFEAGDYGNAILAAQEVLQRDPADSSANGILAVSGLRVATGAVNMLRQQGGLGADTRTQAEQVVRTMREALGERELFRAPGTAGGDGARPSAAPPANAAARPQAAPRPAPQSAAPAAPSAQPRPSPTAPRPPQNAPGSPPAGSPPSGNPFGGLAPAPPATR